MPDDTTPDWLVAEIGYFLAQEGAKDRPNDFADHLLTALTEHGWGDLAEVESLTTDVQLKMLEARDEADQWQRQYGKVMAELAEVTRERDEARADAERYTGWLAAANVELNQAGRTVDRMRPVVEAAQSWRGRRLDPDAIHAVLSALERYEHPAVEVEVPGVGDPAALPVLHLDESFEEDEPAAPVVARPDGRCYRFTRIRGDSRQMEESMPCTLPLDHAGDVHRYSTGFWWMFDPAGPGFKTVAAPAGPLSAPVEPVQGETAPEGGDGLDEAIEAAKAAYGYATRTWPENMAAAVRAAAPIIRRQALLSVAEFFTIDANGGESA